MDPYSYIVIADCLYRLTKAKHSTDLLSPEAVRFFGRFKCSYDAKDVKGVSRCFAPKCEIDFYGAESKRQLVEVFGDLFGQLWAFVNPHLTITLYRIDENSERGFQAIVSFNAKCKAGGWEVPFTDYATGKAICRIEPSSTGSSLWHITRLTHDDD
jgi:hypothetical protein